MKNRIWLVLALISAGATMSGCAPVVLGAAGAIVVDEAMEQRRGGDGLF